MTQPPIVLASGSPRRRQLLEMLGIPIIVMPADVQEIPLPRESAADYSRRLARDKARAVPGEYVLGADTIVLLDGEILEKPSDDEEAFVMLSRLQGRSHQVLTSICVVHNGAEYHAHDYTTVTFAPADASFLRAYVATGEPRDKSGSYGIQGFGAALIEKIDGDFFSVMGLPVRKVLTVLGEAGWVYRFA